MARVCVECGARVPLLVRDYGKGNIRLAICAACNCVADKYVEYETVLLFLEVLLLRPQVYRHVLYNLPAPMDARTLLKLFVILVMLDMNVKAYLIDRRAGLTFRSASIYADTAQVSGLRISQFSLHLVALALVENLAYFGAVLALAWLDPLRRGWRARLLEHAASSSSSSISEGDTSSAPTDAQEKQPSAVAGAVVAYASAMVVSSFGKLFALLTVIWEYDWTFVHVTGSIVFFSNLLALQLLLQEGEPAAAKSWRVALLLAAGVGARLAVQLLLFALGNPVLFHVLV